MKILNLNIPRLLPITLFFIVIGAFSMYSAYLTINQNPNQFNSGAYFLTALNLIKENIYFSGAIVFFLGILLELNREIRKSKNVS